MNLFRGAHRSGRRERGQVLVLFTIAAVAIIAIVGLVIDGGWTFVQRRDQQNVADAAAMAAGYGYVNSNYNAASAISAGMANATANGYQNGADGVTVTISVNSSNIVVNVTKPHQNFFSGIVGFGQWNVSTTATVEAGIPNDAEGAMPIIVNQKAVTAHGFGPDNAFSYNEPAPGNNSVPQDSATFNWTVFCAASGNACNSDSSTIDNLIQGQATNPQDVNLGMTIDPLNSGDKTAMFSDLANYIGKEFPIAIVDDNGNFLGLALFHLTGSVGGSTKQVSGYFVGPVNSHGFKIRPGVAPGTNSYGTYAVDLIN
jgi:Flp pilus assembly protein TadG